MTKQFVLSFSDSDAYNGIVLRDSDTNTVFYAIELDASNTLVMRPRGATGTSGAMELAGGLNIRGYGQVIDSAGRWLGLSFDSGSGNFVLRTGDTMTGSLTITNTDSSDRLLVLNPSSPYSGNIVEVYDSSANQVIRIEKNGWMKFFGRGGTTDTRGIYVSSGRIATQNGGFRAYAAADSSKRVDITGGNQGGIDWVGGSDQPSTWKIGHNLLTDPDKLFFRNAKTNAIYMRFGESDAVVDIFKPLTITDTSGVTTPLTVNGAEGASSLQLLDNGSLAALVSATGNILSGPRTSGVPGDVGSAVRSNGIGEFVKAGGGRAYFNFDSAVAEFSSRGAGVTPLRLIGTGGANLIDFRDSGNTAIARINANGNYLVGDRAYGSPGDQGISLRFNGIGEFTTTGVSQTFINSGTVGVAITNLGATNNPLKITGAAAQSTPSILLEGGAGQTGWYIDIRDSAGSTGIFNVNQIGSVNIGKKVSAAGTTGHNLGAAGNASHERDGYGKIEFNQFRAGQAITYIESFDSARVGLQVRAATPTQITSLAEWQNSVGTAVARVDPLGKWAFTSDGTFYGPGDSNPAARPPISLSGGAPAIDMFAVGIPDTHKLTRLQKTTTGFRIVKGDRDGNALQNLYDVSVDSSGATGHTWNIGAAAPLLLNSTGLTVGQSVTVQGAVGQTASLQEWQDSVGSVLATVEANGNFRSASPTIPDSATAPGLAGEFAWSASHFYVCTATNQWKRAALLTW